MSNKYEAHITKFGMDWGPCDIKRLFSDSKRGVWIQVSGKRESVDIRITKGGRLRIFNVQKTKKQQPT